MTLSNEQTLLNKEQFALKMAMFGNLFMAAAGFVAAALSNSQAIMLDGMFSLIGFAAAVIARRIAKNALAAPDKKRPFGYSMDESIFTTFRSLSLLGLVFFAVANALVNIVGYYNGAVPEPLNYAPMSIYFAVIGLTCFALWFFHWQAWRKTGRKSEILRLESTSFAFDGAITAAAGIGLIGFPYLLDGPFAVVVPIGDSIIVLFLCGFAFLPYLRNLTSSIGELAGVTAAPKQIARARRGVRDLLAKQKMRLVDLSVQKSGRTFFIMLYLQPPHPMSAEDVDQLTDDLSARLSDLMGNVYVVVVLSRKGRA